MGLSSVEAPRGESHHFVITGENNRPRRWRVRAPTYQNLQAFPTMIKDQQLADMTITLGSIDPCFSCTDRLETIDLQIGRDVKVWSQEELLKLDVREAETDPQGVHMNRDLMDDCGRAGQRRRGAAGRAVVRRRAAQGHGAPAIAPGTAARGSLTSTC